MSGGFTPVDFEKTNHSIPLTLPRIGCGLAGGKWEEVSRIIEEELIANGVQVMVYDLPL